MLQLTNLPCEGARTCSELRRGSPTELAARRLLLRGEGDVAEAQLLLRVDDAAKAKNAMPLSKMLCRNASEDFQAVGEAENVFGKYPELQRKVPGCGIGMSGLQCQASCGN